jgi:hypothetical protein
MIESVDENLGRLLAVLASLGELDNHDPGDQGVLVAHGDQGGGYILYIENGDGQRALDLIRNHNSTGPLPGRLEEHSHEH